MKKVLLTLVMITALWTTSEAQTIDSRKIMGGYQFSQNGNVLSFRQLVRVMEPNRQAYPIIKKARTNNTIASIIGFAGGGAIGYSLGSVIGGGKANWPLFGVGVGLIGIGIPISINARNQAVQAVQLYNSTAGVGSAREMEIFSDGNRLGLRLRF